MLESVQKYFCQFGGSILICIGTISCFVNLLVFCQKNLRKNPCSIYLMAYNCSNLFQTYPILRMISLLTHDNIIPMLYNVDLCRFSVYISLLVDILSPSYLLMAAIERLFITSLDTRFQRFSTRRFTCMCVLVGTLFWALFHGFLLDLTNVAQLTPNYFLCYVDYRPYLAYYCLIIKSILTPVLMIILAMQILYNIRRIHLVTSVHAFLNKRLTREIVREKIHFKDQQLIRILLTQIGIYTLFNVTGSIYIIHKHIIQYKTKPINQLQIELFLQYLTTVYNYIPCCIGCYCNALASQMFRTDTKKILFY
ncbi:unnamed protein product [Adineta ricciae]|uniref:G-protein coupled receptors family 1 profile domain-containing protein n=1 Tax=Adineta ricciae TaxID=249248 RepID=A0A813NX84_ADIRI|nr:unnamed protein product [Adineta ricciae]CAF0793130.1 unnamed protein product [Adineta ricciae]